MSRSRLLRWWVSGGITLSATVVCVHGQTAPVPYDREEAGDVVGSTLVTPPVIVYSRQSQGNGAVASVAGLEADVYRTLDNEPGTYGVFINLSPSTGLVFPGAMVADNMGLGNGFVAGVHEISSYDLLVFRSSLDPQPGPADFHVELWDGDPLCMFETPGGGYACGPIPGTEADFVNVPANTTMTARAILGPGVMAPHDHVWMVLSGSETANPSPCSLGWDISYDLPVVGSTNGLDVIERQSDEGGVGSCCGDGSACDVSGGQTCPDDDSGQQGFCSDGDAESLAAWTISGSRCDSYGGAGYCSNLVASIQTPAQYGISLLPTGNDVAGNLDEGASIEGHHITLLRGGTSVFVEIRIDDWDPGDLGTQLKAWLVTINSAGYTSGLEGALSPKLVACSTDEDCRTAYGGFCEWTGTACVVDADCPNAPLEPCGGSTCDFPEAGGGYCQPGFILVGRSDYVFQPAIGDLPHVDTAWLDYWFASAVTSSGLDPPSPFPADGLYAGTLVLDVPPGARGTFTVDMKPLWDTLLKSMMGNVLVPLGLRPVEITVETGQCCYHLDGADHCVDGVTVDDCEALGASSKYIPGATCGIAPYTCDCNDNGVADDDDVIAGTSPDCNTNTIPDECEADCNANASPDDCDILDGTSADCNANQVPDDCEPAQIDCNYNGIADGCDLRDLTSADCDGNGVPDECEPDCDGDGAINACEIADGTTIDADGNGVPDECECPPAVPLPDVPAVEKNRYLSFVPGNFGQETALRVTLTSMPVPFDALSGMILWVGPPHEVSELGGVADALPPTFTAATLQCGSYFMDWGGIGALHVYHQNIIPGALYTIQAVDVGCDLANEGSFSPTLGVTTGRWGDLVGPYSEGAWGPPDGVVSVAFDAVALIDAFRSMGDAPHKSSADLSPETPDRLITVSDLTKVLFAFSGWTYPFPVDASPCGP